MPLLEGLEKEFKETKPFKGLKVALSVHLEAKTAHLCEVLAEGGAADRKDIKYLNVLPVFNADGSIK